MNRDTDSTARNNGAMWGQILTAIIGTTLVVCAFVMMVTVPERIEAMANSLIRSSTPTTFPIAQTPDPQSTPNVIEPSLLPTIEQAVQAGEEGQREQDEPINVRIGVVRVPQATPTQAEPIEPIIRWPVVTEIGRSVENRAIEMYTFGDGDTVLTLVGGIHGGYEWNSAVLAYEMITFLQDNPAEVPPSFTIHVIPAANPDGLFLTFEQEGEIDIPNAASFNLNGERFRMGRFNANGVDLNRNWDCEWQEETVWLFGTLPRGGGTEPFSEPETRALKAHFERGEHTAAVFWHSVASAVYPGFCDERVEESFVLTYIYAEAAAYTPAIAFVPYPVTGTAGSWLGANGIPTITVELATQDDIEWERNLSGIRAIITHYSP